MRLDDFLKSTRIRDEQEDSDWLKRRGLVSSNSHYRRMIKGESEAQEEASLRSQGLQRIKERSTIKGIQDREMDEGIIKLMQQDFKESDWWKMGFGDP